MQKIVFSLNLFKADFEYYLNKSQEKETKMGISEVN